LDNTNTNRFRQEIKVVNSAMTRKVATLAVVAALCACSPIMEANRPDPVDVNQFALGQSKISVMSEVGGPIATTPDGLNSFDLYKLFTRRPDRV
jgi:hypothetical protein